MTGRDRVDEPAEPGREHGSELDRERPGDVAGCVMPHRAGVDELRAAVEALAELVELERGSAGTVP